jgi:hypothetical protein
MNTTLLYHALRTALVAVLLAAAWPPAMAENKSDIWWNPAEAGEGLIIIDHETDLFVVWCTYFRGLGLPIWYVTPGGKLSADRRTFEGKFYYTEAVGDGDITTSGVHLLGTATIDFEPAGLPPGWARYSMHYGSGPGPGEIHDVKRQQFGSESPDWGGDSTDMWWDPENPGWGVATIQHGRDDIFAVVLTYDYDGNATFFAAPSQPLDDGVSKPDGIRFLGIAYSTHAAPGPLSFDPATVTVRNAGFAAMRFIYGGFEDDGPTKMQFDTDVAYVPNRYLVRLPFGTLR